MKISNKLIISFGIFFITFCTLFLFRTIPVTQLWKGYQVVYVKSEKLTEENILSILNKNGCKQVITRSQQALPVISKLAPVQAQRSDSYIFKRNGFFTDKSNSYKVFYVPDSQSKAISDAILEMSSSANTDCGTDGDTSFPWISPIICLIFALALIYFSGYNIPLILSYIPLVCFSFTRPLFSVCTALILTMTAFFISRKIWKREGLLDGLLKSPVILGLAGFPFIVLVLFAPVSAFLYLLAFTSSLNLLFVYDQIKNLIISEKTSFNFVYIKKAEQVQLMNRFNFFVLCSVFAVILVNLLIYFATASFSKITVSSETAVELPSPVSSGGELPDLIDFEDWSWQTISYPYRKSGNPFEITRGEKIFITDYNENVSGIKSSSHPVLTYDNSFISGIYKQLENLNYESVEKLMLCQGKNSRFGYSASRGTSSEKNAVLLMIIFMIVPIFLGVYYIMGKNKYGIR